MKKNFLINLKGKLTFYSILLGSISLFIYYLNLNYSVNYYDEAGYLQFAQDIHDFGLFNVESSLRTYLFPFIISIFLSLSDGNIYITKIAMSIFQYLIYAFTIVFIATNVIGNLRENLKTKIIGFSILFFGLLNPYLIQSTTLFLTDLLASCFSVLAISLVLYKDISKVRVSALSIFLIYTAIMIRPSSLIFLPLVFMFSIYKLIKLNNRTNKSKFKTFVKYLSLVCLLLVVFLPQIYMNVTKFGHFTPLMHESLYESQSKWATQSLKYGTVTYQDENPQLFFTNPIELKGEYTIFELIYNNFFAFIVVYSAHIFGVFDWGYIDTYINEFYPESRILGSLFLYTTWFLIFSGVIKVLKNRNKYKSIKMINLGLLISAVLYTLFIATTLIESRFGYPIFLLMLPFLGFGLEKMKFTLLKVISFCSIILVCFIISFLIDMQTNRINWFTYLTN